MIKRLWAALLLALLLLSAFAEGGKLPDKSIYDEILMSDTLETITEKYGEGTATDGYLLFGDALCSFFESGRLQAKSRCYTDIREVAALTQGSFNDVTGFTQGTEESELIAYLGEGEEVLVMNLSDEDEAGLRKLIAWRNENNAVLEALFELDDGKWVLFALGEIK